MKAVIAAAILATATPALSATPGPLTYKPLPMHISGHVAVRQMGPVRAYDYQWPGVYFEAAFTGLSVSLKFDDSANNFNVLVDGKPYMILRRPGDSTVTIAVASGPHTIRLEKRSETQYATGRFYGFNATTSAAAPARARQIEFIGDSLTVGYGNTSPYVNCTTDEIFETTDSQQGFGPVTAKHFNADYQVNAFSGLGMVRNYDGREHPKYHMPMLHDRAIFDEPAADAQPGWHPQIIVIGIGGNDFSTPVRPDEPWHDAATLRADYVKTYTAFVKTLRARNPGAFILLATPPDAKPDYIGGTDDVFAAIKAGGDTKIDRFILPQMDAAGCNGHPTIRADADAADAYIAYIEAHPALWQGK